VSALTQRQQEALSLLAGDTTHNLLYGGSRSGKTYLLIKAILTRALKSPYSRHVIFRFRLNAIKATIWLDTLPKVLKNEFAGLDYTKNNTDFYITLLNGSEVWCGGLDDNDRVEKILGMEFVTVYFNECSQIPYHSRNTALTRLAQKTEQTIDGITSDLKTRVYYDCNPPSKGHWVYKVFFKKTDPETSKPLTSPDNYASYQINPQDNTENISNDYMDLLQSQSPRLQKRFLLGEFADDNPYALFNDINFDVNRITDGVVPDFVRIIIGVDPSGAGDTDNENNDATGIVVCALGTDGDAYVLEDLTVKASPGIWGNVIGTTFDRLGCDLVVAEKNYGGDMVRHTIQVARASTPFKAVTASRGKAVRAEPISALYEKNKVHHVGYMRELEDELLGFTVQGNYLGDKSPNRADALVWALTELFYGMVRPVQAHVMPDAPRAASWMSR
jgi:hypothetical protein